MIAAERLHASAAIPSQIGSAEMFQFPEIVSSGPKLGEEAALVFDTPR